MKRLASEPGLTNPNPNLTLEFEPRIKFNHKILQLRADTLV